MVYLVLKFRLVNTAEVHVKCSSVYRYMELQIPVDIRGGKFVQNANTGHESRSSAEINSSVSLPAHVSRLFVALCIYRLYFKTS